ncbi:MAG: FMN-binding protein [Lachnospiraceae bacterium]|nr:FMN-binding protein [Lachnospiraceae bacterium]
MADSLASYQEVCPDAESFQYDSDLDDAIEALGDDIYDSAFGKTYINEAVVGYDANGEIVGYVISVTSGDGFDGDITLSVGLTTDGTVVKIAFTTLNETAGMGMRVDEDAFKGQFEGVSTDAFVLNKSGGSTEENEIDTVSGASTSSGAVVNAVNTALAFFAANIG